MEGAISCLFILMQSKEPAGAFWCHVISFYKKARIQSTSLEGGIGTHRQDLHVFGDVVLPCKAEDVREVKGEVNNAAAGRSQVGLVEEDAQEEALHDGSHGEGQQKEEEDDSIAVVQHSSSL